MDVDIRTKLLTGKDNFRENRAIKEKLAEGWAGRCAELREKMHQERVVLAEGGSVSGKFLPSWGQGTAVDQDVFNVFIHIAGRGEGTSSNLIGSPVAA